jgi:hypothetical protein
MIEVLKQMVEVLELCPKPIFIADKLKCEKAIQAGKQAIAELESQEPITYYRHYDGGAQAWPDEHTIPLYTHPPQRTEQELYHELLFAVAKAHPNETRHQTALRYIQQAESGGADQCTAAHGITKGGKA